MVFLSKAAAAREGRAKEVREGDGGAGSDSEEPLHVASRLHAFNRFELKYLVPVDQAADIRDELAERMDTDPHSPVGGYGVWSLYYDTPRLRFYWEKIEGLKFRRKLRIRHYGNLDGVTDESPVCVEIKQRVNRVTQKRRITLPYGAARQLCDGREMVEHSAKESAFVQEVLELVVRLNLRPTRHHRLPARGAGRAERGHRSARHLRPPDPGPGPGLPLRHADPREPVHDPAAHVGHGDQGE